MRNLWLCSLVLQRRFLIQSAILFAQFRWVLSSTRKYEILNYEWNSITFHTFFSYKILQRIIISNWKISWGGCFLVNDMQTPFFSTKRAVFHFWSKMTRNVLKRMENQFSNFVTISILPIKNSSPKRCAMFWNRFFLVIEIWSILYSTFLVNWGLIEIYCGPD